MSDFALRTWRSPDGLALSARDYAGAPGAARLPVICLHGLTRNARDFGQVAPRLAASGRRVLVPDVRGRGQSQWDPRPANYQPRTYAADILALMDVLGIARAVFVGTSMGGIITMILAGLRTRAVAAAILNDVGPEIGAAGLARILSYAGKSADVASWDAAEAFVRNTYGVAYPGFDDDDWQAFVRQTFRDEDGRPRLDYDPAISAAFGGKTKTGGLAASLLFRKLARGRPTLLVRGALSDLLTADLAQNMQRSAPTLRIAEVPDVGHAPTLNEPAAVAAIDDFLGSVP